MGRGAQLSRGPSAFAAGRIMGPMLDTHIVNPGLWVSRYVTAAMGRRRPRPGTAAGPAEAATEAGGTQPWPNSRTAELLEGVCDVDLDQLDVELPRGFGRDLNAPALDRTADNRP